MKNIKIFAYFFMPLLFASLALAQHGNADLPDAPQPQASTAEQAETTAVAATGDRGKSQMIAQAGRYPRAPRGPMRPRGRAYPGGFAPPPPPALSPVGALIGFGIGATIGASHSADGTVQGHVALGLIVGAVGALMGGAIGGANPFFHARRAHRPLDRDDDEESNLRRGVEKSASQQSVVGKAASPGQPAVADPTAPTLSEPLAAP
jgi:hypothetical protein